MSSAGLSKGQKQHLPPALDFHRPKKKTNEKFVN
jgi:hypothetical protein